MSSQAVKVSYCSVCKGRLSQLKQTYLINLEVLRNINAEWIIVDYDCPDKTTEALLELPITKEFIANGKLKLYKFSKEIPFIMPLAKNLSHSVATGTFLFNLDIDNFIGSSFEQLTKLSRREFLYPGDELKKNGTMGRIGLHREVFNEIGGYDLELDVSWYEDINLISRLNLLNLKGKVEKDIKYPIQNTSEQTVEYSDSTRNFREIAINSRNIHNEKINKGIINVNTKGLLYYQDEDLTEYLQKVTIDE